MFKRLFKSLAQQPDVISDLRTVLTATDLEAQNRVKALEELNSELTAAVEEIKTLSGTIVNKLQGQVNTLSNELAAVGKASYDVIFILDYRGNIISSNEIIQKVFGYTQDEVHKKNISKLIPFHLKAAPNHPKTFSKIIEKISGILLKKIHNDVLEDEDSYYNKISSINRLDGIHKDGHDVLVDVTINVISTTVTSIKEINYVCIIRDATEITRAKADLKSIKFQMELLENIPTPIFWKDKDFKIAWCNIATEKLYGIERSEIIGSTIIQLFDKFIPLLTEEKQAWVKAYVERDTEIAAHLASEAAAGKRIRRHFYKSKVFNVATDGLKDAIIYRNAMYDNDNNFEGIIYYVIDMSGMLPDTSWLNLVDKPFTP